MEFDDENSLVDDEKLVRFEKGGFVIEVQTNRAPKYAPTVMLCPLFQQSS